MTHIGVVGAGAWGTALAMASVRAGARTTLWAREPEVATAVNQRHENTTFLPGIKLSPELQATANLGDMADCDHLLLVTPAQHLREITADLSDIVATDKPMVICAKGIETKTGYLMSDVLAETMGANPVAVLTGPTFAHEVARGLPSAVTLACESEFIGQSILDAIGQSTFRPYYSDDVIGAQIGGSLKNVLAIACGVVHGLELGENARAAVITRGMAEMMRFGAARGARSETLMGLSGLGDLILTCSSTQSRNMSLGAELGTGKSMQTILAERNSVSEGVWTAKVVVSLGRDMGLDLPICEAVYSLLYEETDIATVMDDLLARPFKREAS